MSITRRKTLLFGSSLLAGYQVVHAGEGSDRELSAREILERMAAAYLRCGSYRDSGRVTSVFNGADGRRTEDTQDFNTAFIRPSRFRFEFVGDGHRFLVSADGAATHTWWDLHPVVDDAKSLDLSLAGATGISGGAAHTVPVMLMPDRVTGQRPTNLSELERLADADLGGVACFRVQGATPFSRDAKAQETYRQQLLKMSGQDIGLPKFGPEVLWIERGTWLLRRIETKTEHSTFSQQTVTTYEPAFDTTITDGQLAFDPPAQKS